MEIFQQILHYAIPALIIIGLIILAFFIARNMEKHDNENNNDKEQR